MELQSDLSKRDIADALISLMKKKDFSKITNKDITDRAGLSHITIYRNFKDKEEILKYYLNDAFKNWNNKWQDEDNSIYRIFEFFQDNSDTIDLLYKANVEHILIDNILDNFDYKDSDPNIFAYSKVMIAYMVFGLCNEWYKRGMKETPEEIINLINQQKNNE